MDPVVFNNIRSFLCDGILPPALSKVQQNNFRRKTKNFELQDGLLYYVRHKGQPNSTSAKVLCGQEEANNVFIDFHASSHGAHCGQKKTREAISLRFYWPGMSDDIHQWVAQCPECQANSVIIKQEVKSQPIKVTTPFELVGMDLIGKLKTTENGNQYICVLIDYLTKWPQAYAIKSKTAQEVSQCLLKFFYQFEAPKRILTDQGREFVNEINSNVCKLLGIKRSLCAPYHPQTNGLVERMNGTIQRALAKLVHDRPDVWDQHLDAVMFGLRTKRQVTTKFSPFYLMFGREARYPSEIPEEYTVDSSVEDNLSVEEVTENVLKLDDALQSAIQNIKDNPKPKKGKKTAADLQVGMKVLRINVRSQQRKGGKLEANYLGPFTISSITGKSVDLVDPHGITIPKINMDHLVPYTEGKKRVPRKLSTGPANTSSSNAPPAAASSSGPPAAPDAPPSTSLPAAASSSGLPAAPASSGLSAAPASSGPSAAPASTSLLAVASSTGPPAAASPSGPPAAPASSGPPAAPASTSLLAVASSSGPPAAPDAPPSTSPPAAASSSGLPAAPASSGLSAAPASSGPSAEPASSGPSAEPASSGPPAAPASTSLLAVASSTGPPAAASSSGPPAAASSSGPPAAASSSSPPAAASSSGPPAAASSSGPPAAASSSGPPAAASSSSPPAAASSSGPPAAASSSSPPAAASSSSPPAAASSSGPPTTSSSDGRRTTAISDVRDAWGGKRAYVLLSKVGPYKIFYNDIFNTGPQMEFESEVINAYLTKLVERYNQNNNTRAFAVDTYEITRIWEGKKPKIKITPQLYEFILGVVNQAHHWMLVVILPAKKKTLFLDPLGEKKTAVNQCKDVTRSFMRQRGLNPSRWACETTTHSIQQDATSCGAFALKFAECILDGLPLVFDTSPSSVNTIREEIAVCLLMNTDDLTNLCHICGEHAGDTLWIGCDMCPRWYHKSCAKYPKKGRRAYVCEACQ